MSSEINILCGTDKNFLNYTYVTYASLIKNHPDNKLIFHLLISDDIDSNDVESITNYVKSTNNELITYRMNVEEIDSFITNERFSKATWYRLLAHLFLPKELDRVLYLDVDLIVTKNISEFYNTDFNGKYLIAASHCPDPSWFNKITSKTVDLKSAAKGGVFNAGVLIFNLDKFRENINIDSYIKAYNEILDKKYNMLYDQGLLNYMFYDKTLYVSSMDYNYRYSIPQTYEKKINNLIQYKKAIIHYTGMNQPYKPWDLVLEDDEVDAYGNMPFKDGYFYVSKELNDLSKLWWSYAELTPVYENLKRDLDVKHTWYKRNLHKLLISYNNLLSKKNEFTKDLNSLKKENEELKNVKSSITYKVGSIITWIPRQIKKTIKKVNKK